MCDVTKIRNGENWRAEDVFVVDEFGVGGGVGVALGFETENFGVFFVCFDGDDAVGDDGVVAVCDVRDDVADFERFIVRGFNVDHGANGVFWFHGAGHDCEGFEAEDFGADEGGGEDGDEGGGEGAKAGAEEFEATEAGPTKASCDVYGFYVGGERGRFRGGDGFGRDVGGFSGRGRKRGGVGVDERDGGVKNLTMRPYF